MLLRADAIQCALFPVERNTVHNILFPFEVNALHGILFPVKRNAEHSVLHLAKLMLHVEYLLRREVNCVLIALMLMLLNINASRWVLFLGEKIAERSIQFPASKNAISDVL
jgi:hypothetical protein